MFKLFQHQLACVFYVLFAIVNLNGGAAVSKYILPNQFTLLIKPVDSTQQISMQLWVYVGSKDEKTGEKGMAHLIEHELFKGTDLQSESDMPLIAQKLSGSCNATTSFDWTRLYFNVPPQHWQLIMPILADCMRNCTFKQELLNSEMKAVVQELKMYKDYYGRILVEKMLGAIFVDHPYHYPVVGFKQDLWNLNTETLINFYKKHYVPNNAVLVVVGDVKPEEVYEQALLHFGSIPADPNYKKEEFYLNKDICTKSVTVYRDIKQDQVMLAFVIPGVKNRNNYIVDVLGLSLAGGKSSRLHKKLVDELQIVDSVGNFWWNLFDYDLFIIRFQPKKSEDINTIIGYIQNELADIGQNGITQAELARTSKQVQVDMYSLLESNYDQASEIGESYLATRDENYILKYQIKNLTVVQEQLKEFVREYLRPAVMHTGFLVPLPEGEKEHWARLQDRSDEEDARILAGKIRESEVEPGKYVHQLKVEDPKQYVYAKPKILTLSNGIKVLYHHNDNIPKIKIVLELAAGGPEYEPEDLPGLYHMLVYLAREGTERYTAEQLAEELESRGIHLNIGSGAISMSLLSEDFPKGLELLEEILSRSIISDEAVEKVRAWALSDYKHFVDNQSAVAGQLMSEILYKNHPYSKFAYGTEESLKKITREDLYNFYKKNISPYGARIAIVGDLRGYDIQAILNDTLGKWNGPAIEEIHYPELEPIQPQEVKKYMDRDQVVLAFAGLSIDRKNPDYDKLLLFDQIFAGGMNSRLFNLREKTGAFYSISGSLISGSGMQPGMVYISTIVSRDRLQEVENMIRTTIDTIVDTITQEELIDAKRVILSAPANSYSTNSAMASTFLFLDRYELPFDYFETHKETLDKITLNQVKDAARKILSNDKMVTIKVGRV